MVGLLSSIADAGVFRDAVVPKVAPLCWADSRALLFRFPVNPQMGALRNKQAAGLDVMDG